MITCDVADEEDIRAQLIALTQRSVQTRCDTGRIPFIAERDDPRSQRSQRFEIAGKGEDRDGLSLIEMAAGVSY